MAEKFHRPPPPEDLDPVDYELPIAYEAQRQVKIFYPFIVGGMRERTLLAIQAGILAMVKKGAAQVQPDGKVLFWNPIEGHYQVYDEDYNILMLHTLGALKGGPCGPAHCSHREEEKELVPA